MPEHTKKDSSNRPTLHFEWLEWYDSEWPVMQGCRVFLSTSDGHNDEIVTLFPSPTQHYSAQDVFDEVLQRLGYNVSHSDGPTLDY